MWWRGWMRCSRDMRCHRNGGEGGKLCEETQGGGGLEVMVGQKQWEDAVLVPRKVDGQDVNNDQRAHVTLFPSLVW